MEEASVAVENEGFEIRYRNSRYPERKLIKILQPQFLPSEMKISQGFHAMFK